jgi:phosphodiesterase/alkaline phosphatase D-like protein
MGAARGLHAPFVVLPGEYELSDSAGGLSMNILLLKLAMSVVVASLFYSTPAVAQVAATTKKAASVKITQGPEIERADPYLTIVRWTTNNPGGSPEHYGVVHYGTSPKDLSQTAKSPIRLNPGHSDTVFRVRIEGLKPGTTYYYKVDSIEAYGKGDGVNSKVNTFKTK